jgi:hypothetical protein
VKNAYSFDENQIRLQLAKETRSIREHISTKHTINPFGRQLMEQAYSMTLQHVREQDELLIFLWFWLLLCQTSTKFLK